MATMTFDTHKFYQLLEDSGVPRSQAEAMIRMQQESLQAAFDYRDLATKGDVASLRTDTKGGIDALRSDTKEMEHRIDIKLERINSEITLLKWMNGLIVGGIVALVIKAFIV